jgi:hypothetical protein
MDSPESTQGGNTRQQRRIRGLRARRSTVELTLIFTICFATFTVFMLHSLARNSVPDHNDVIDQPTATTRSHLLQFKSIEYCGDIKWLDTQLSCNERVQYLVSKKHMSQRDAKTSLLETNECSCSSLPADHNDEVAQPTASSTQLQPQFVEIEGGIIQSYTEICEGCRQSPSIRSTCGERVQYLINRYGTSPNDAVNKVMQEQPQNCVIRRFNITNDIIADIVNGEENYTLFKESMYSKLNSSISVKKAQPMLGKVNISIFVYEDDTIPYNIGLGVQKDMISRYSSMNMTYENFKADLAIFHLFQTFPGRTRNPNEADFFVVPYLHASHCLQLNTLKSWFRECQHVSRSSIQDEIIGNLIHYKGNEKRHLFINSMEAWHAHPLLRNVPLSLTHGPRLNEGGYHIVIPYLSDDPSFQPSVLNRRGKQWWIRPRRIALTYFFGSVNRNMKKDFRRHRQLFIEEVRTNWTLSPYLGQLPYVVESLGSHKLHSKNGLGYFNSIYRQSVFCPVLPGDAPPQKRFFDVIIMGCIPVVLDFETDFASQSKTSWHSPGGFPIELSYPFAKHSNSIDPENEIDYESFVVQVKEVSAMRKTLENILQNQTEIQRLQLNLMKNAQYFLYGMGDDSHLHEDAFVKILQSLQYYSQKVRPI